MQYKHIMMYFAILVRSGCYADAEQNCSMEKLTEKLRAQQEKLHVVTDYLAQHKHLDSETTQEIKHLLTKSPLKNDDISLADIQEQIALNDSVTMYLTTASTSKLDKLEDMAMQTRSDITNKLSIQSLMQAYEKTNARLNTFINNIASQYLQKHVLKHMLASSVKFVKNTNITTIAKRIWPYAILFTHWIRNKTVAELQAYNSVYQLYKQFLMDLGIGGLEQKKPFIYPTPSGNPELDMQALQEYKNAGWAIEKQKQYADFYNSNIWNVNVTKLGFNVALLTVGNHIKDDAYEFINYIKTNFKTPIEEEIAAIEAA